MMKIWPKVKKLILIIMEEMMIFMINIFQKLNYHVKIPNKKMKNRIYLMKIIKMNIILKMKIIIMKIKLIV